MYRKLFSLSTYTKHATTILFVIGFTIDMILLPDIGDALTRYIGLAYISSIAVLIVVREWVASRNTASALEQRVYSTLTFCIAYLSGSALSFVFVYAIRGAAFSVSWPFLVILLICSISNEMIGSHKYRFTLDIAVLFVALLFYIIFTLPILLSIQNDLVFLGSMILSVVIGLIYISILKNRSEVATHEAGRGYALAIGIPMFVGMLYFLNVLPAVPLSLGSSGVYHSVVRDGADFIVEREVAKKHFIPRFWSRPVYHMSSDDTGVYFLATVKAPTKVTAPLTQVWEYYDEDKKKWVSNTVIPYISEGGRVGGYRAYSYKNNVAEGLWRVTIKADSKRIVGRLTFTIVRVEEPVLQETVRL